MFFESQALGKLLVFCIFVFSTTLNENQAEARRRSRCLPQLCHRCQSYIHSRWRRSATARPPDVTSYPHEDFDVTFDDVIQDDIYEDIEEDRQLYRIPESDYDDSGVFEEDQHESDFNNGATNDFDMNWQLINTIAQKAFHELGEENSRRQRDKVFQLIKKEQETSQTVTNKFMKKLMKKIDKAITTLQESRSSSSSDTEMSSNKRSTESHLRKCYKILLTPCCKRVTVSKSPCFLCWL